jgi:hypothetical protein
MQNPPIQVQALLSTIGLASTLRSLRQILRPAPSRYALLPQRRQTCCDISGVGQSYRVTRLA